MCGIAGIFSYSDEAPPVDTGELLRIRDRMVRRGPDGAGLWTAPNGRVALAHRRLAIIDLTAAGAQPMATANGRYHVVFSGEIYNYKELRSELERSGAIFRSNSDTEVLLQLYAQHHEGMCRRLRGMFALAIWDAKEQCLFLARDPFGIKPLYVHDDGRTVRFASQVKALLAGGAIPTEIESAGEVGYWIWGSVPEPWTIYKNILTLEPGFWLRLHRTGRRETAAFESIGNLLTAEHNDPPVNLRETLLDSVRHHLIADVPVGIFLSAGIDSSTLAAVAADLGSDLRTVTLGFEQFRGTENDETTVAEQVARRLGSRHETVWITKRDFDETFDAFIAEMDQPSIDGLNMWLVSGAAAKIGLKVAISGLGGDEFFGGYSSFKELPRLRRLVRPFGAVPGLGKALRIVASPILNALFRTRVNSQKIASILEYGSTWKDAYVLRRALRMPWELGRDRATPAAMVPFPPALTEHATVTWLESTLYMRNQLLRDSDWAGMAHSLEIRVPFVDTAVAQAVGKQARSGRPWTKQDLVTAARTLPPAVSDRKKTGFVIPIRTWAGHATGNDERGLRSWQASILRRQIRDGRLNAAKIGDRILAPTAFVITHSPSPYQTELFDAVSASGQVDLVVLYLHVTDQARDWAPRKLSHCCRFATDLTRESPEFKRLVEESDTVVINYYQSKLSVSAVALRRNVGTPIVFWGERPHEHMRAWASRAWRAHMFEGVARENLNVWGIGRIATAHYEREFRLFHSSSNIPYYSDLSRFCPTTNARSARKSEDRRPIVFLYSGSLIRRKGVDVLARAFLNILTDGIDAKLIVLGAGEMRREIEKVLRDHKDAIDFAGFKDWDALPAAYAGADILCAPSRHDGWGLVVLEGLAAGLPVISTTATGAAVDLIRTGVNGWLTSPGDAGNLASAMKAAAVMTGAELQVMSRAARDSVAGHQLRDGAAAFASAIKKTLTRAQ